jgi:hypothetical protein
LLAVDERQSCVCIVASVLTQDGPGHATNSNHDIEEFTYHLALRFLSIRGHG